MWLETTRQHWLGCLGLDAAVGCQLQVQDGWLLFVGLGLAWLLIRRGSWLFNAIYTLRAAALMPALSRHLSLWVKRREYDEDAFFRADGAAAHWAERRQKALDRLATYFQTKYAKSVDWGNDIRDSFSDLRFIDANRVPFPFMRVIREKFNLCSVVTASKGPKLRDLDGHWSPDVGGSYGVNVAGFERDAVGPGAGEGRRTGSRAAAPAGGRQHRVAQVDFRARRSVVPHERHRSRHGRGAAGALQHPPQTHCGVLRRLPRLVGRRAAGARQRACHQRLPHPEGHAPGVARRDSQTLQGNRRRAHQPGAIVSPQRPAAQRRGAAHQ